MLHCGACGDVFIKSGELARHIDKLCPAKKMLSAYNNIILYANDKGHKKSRLFMAAHKNYHLVNKYANSVAYCLPSVTRSEVHLELCQKSGLQYMDFRPFESEDIKTTPSFDECRRIIYDAIADKTINS